jgi:hypothetical protein
MGFAFARVAMVDDDLRGVLGVVQDVTIEPTLGTLNWLQRSVVSTSNAG